MSNNSLFNHSIINLNKNKSKNINLSYDNRYKLLLGYTNYYTDNIVKYKEAVKQFKDNVKVYNVINPYYYKMIKEKNDKFIDIQTAFYNKYKILLNKSDYFKIFELIKYYKFNNITCLDNITDKICSILKIKVNKVNINDKCKGNILIYNLKDKNYDFIYNNCNNFNTIIIKFKQEELLYINNIHLINDLVINSNSSNIYIPKTSNIFNNDKFFIFNKINNVKKSFDINKSLLKQLIELNNYNIALQTFNINICCQYISNQNYFGDEYKDYLEKQKNSHTKWIKEFI